MFSLEILSSSYSDGYIYNFTRISFYLSLQGVEFISHRAEATRIPPGDAMKETLP